MDGCRFVWDEGKYPVNAPLKETVASIQSQVAKIEDCMKVCFCVSSLVMFFFILTKLI